MGLSVWRETSKKLTVYRVCYTPIETLIYRIWYIMVYGIWFITGKWLHNYLIFLFIYFCFEVKVYLFHTYRYYTLHVILT